MRESNRYKRPRERWPVMTLLLLLVATLVSAGEPPVRLAQAGPETQIRRVWAEFKAALMAKDVERALRAMAFGSRARYRQLFTGFGDHLPEVAHDLPDLDQITVHGDGARGEGHKAPRAPGAPPEPPVIAVFARDPVTGTWYVEGL
jgi:hypothetical protein